jgi:hypothetical protein
MDSFRDEESSLLLPSKQQNASKISPETKFSNAFKTTTAISMAALLALGVFAYSSSGVVRNDKFIDVVRTSTDLSTALPSNAVQDYLCMNQYLAPGENLYSSNGNVRLAYQTDGNLVIYQGSSVLWSPNTYGSGASQAVMQTDGNFVVYAPGGAKWASGTSLSQGFIKIQNDGNLVLYGSTGQVYWASGSNKVSGAVNNNNGYQMCFQPTFSPTMPPVPPTPSPTQGVQAFNGAGGQQNSGSNDDGTINFLDRHNVNCGNNPISGFHLGRDGNRINIQYNCAQTNNVPTSTYGYNTGWQGYGGVIFLDRQSLFCPQNLFMTRYQGNSHYDTLRYPIFDHFLIFLSSLPQVHLVIGGGDRSSRSTSSAARSMFNRTAFSATTTTLAGTIPDREIL